MIEILVSGPGIDPTGATDSASALQALENSASIGSILIFPSGIFTIGTTIQKRSGVSWRGAGKYVTIIKAAAQDWESHLVEQIDQSCTNLKISDMWFDATAMATRGLPAMLSFSNATFIDFDNLYLTGIPAFGIMLAQAKWYRITNCLFVRPPSPIMNEGIWVQNGGGGYIFGNIMEGTGMSICSDPCMIAMNGIFGWGYGSGITTEKQPNGSQHMLIVGNICNGGSGVDQNNVNPMGIENWAEQTLIASNMCVSNSGDGLDVWANTGCVIGTNLIANNAGSNVVNMRVS